MLMFLEDDTGMIQKRFTWTLFHHLSTQSWPTWPSAAIPGEVQKPDPYLEVLCNVPGVENVRIARRVEDATQAAYIISWSSADALALFQESALFAIFMKALPIENAQSEADYTSPSRTISLQFDHGFNMDTKLHGRVTLNKFTGIATWESWHWSIQHALGRVLPLGCRDIARKRPPMGRWSTAWVDQQGGEQQGMWTTAKWLKDEPKIKKVTSRGDEHVRERWVFLRWNEPVYYGATREREEESAKQPGAMQHWEEAIQPAIPPVQTWAQERWDIEKPYFPIAPNEEDVEIDMGDLDLDEEDAMSGTEEDGNLPVGIR